MRPVASGALRALGRMLLVAFLLNPRWSPLHPRRIWPPVYDAPTRSSGR